MLLVDPARLPSRTSGATTTVSIPATLSRSAYDPNKSPKVNNPPLNHIGLWIDDLPACVKYLTEQGVRFTPGGIRKGASGYDITFVHPKGKAPSPLCGEGVLIELVQAPKEVLEFYDKV